MRTARGFTLLEMLVVLVIVALITTLLMESFSFLLQLRGRFLDRLDGYQQASLQQHWFRATSAALVADYGDIPEAFTFRGEERGLQGLTLNALHRDTGVPTRFGWELEYEAGETTLIYRYADGFWPVLRWSGDGGGFRYLDAEGDWHGQWPPPARPDAPSLPEIIAFTGQRQQRTFLWLAEISGKKTPRQDYRVYMDSFSTGEVW